jgi:hypothetical protein
MQKKMLCAIWILVFISAFALVALAGMTSDNYRIQQSVQSGGGTSSGSTNYQTNSTLGQPSPLMDPDDPPFSDSYDLYPGFWYTVAEIGATCPGDFNGDQDVDGDDLADYLTDTSRVDLIDFAANFGRVDCP